PTDATSSSSSDFRPALNVGEITGISLASVAAAAGAIGIFIFLYRRYKRRERRKRRFSKSPMSHDEYMWSPLSPATGKSHDSLLRTNRGVKRSIYDFLGWKPEPSGLDIDSQYTSEPSYKHNPFSQNDGQ